MKLYLFSVGQAFSVIMEWLVLDDVVHQSCNSFRLLTKKGIQKVDGKTHNTILNSFLTMQLFPWPVSSRFISSVVLCMCIFIIH